MIVTPNRFLLCNRLLFQKCSKLLAINFQNYSTVDNPERKIPKCVYVLPPSQWLKNKINFQRIKIFDKDFNEKDFKAGATKAALVVLELARARDSAQLAKVSTIRGFSRIYRDMIASANDPRRRLLAFNPEDIQKVVTTDVHIVEKESNHLCLIEVFFVAIKYMDDVILFYEKMDPNSIFKVSQDIRQVERTLKKKNFTDKMQVPNSEKLLVTEGYVHLFSSFPQNEPDGGWKVDFFKISEFNIVHWKGTE